MRITINIQSATVLFIAVIILLSGVGVFYITVSNDTSDDQVKNNGSPTPALTTATVQTPIPTKTSTSTSTKTSTSTPKTSTSTPKTSTSTPKTSTSTPKTSTSTSTRTPRKENINEYTEFIGRLGGQFTATNTTLHIKGVKVFESNETMWVIYKGGDAADGNWTRLHEWSEIAQAYAFALRSHEDNNESGDVPLKMQVVELNTPEGPGSTYTISSGFARLYAYNKISWEEYFDIWFKKLRPPTEREQRIAQAINKQHRNATFHPNGTWRYTEPPKSQNSSETTTSDESESVAGAGFRSEPPPRTARSVSG